MPKDIIGSGRLRLGLNPQLTGSADSVVPDNALSRMVGQDADTYAIIERYTNSLSGSPSFTVRKANGTLVVPTTVALNEAIGGLRSEARGDTKFWDTADIEIEVDETVVAGQRPASRIVFATGITNGTVTPRAIIYGDGQVAIGKYTGTLRPDTNGEPDSLLSIASEVFDQGFFVAQYESTAGGNGGNVRMGRARGTMAAPTTVVDGDSVGEIEFYAYTGATGKFMECGAGIEAKVDGTVVVNQIAPSRLEFQTSPANSVQVTRMVLNKTGVLALTTSGTAPVVSGNNYGAIQIMSTAPVSGIFLGNAVNAATNVLDWYEEGTWTPNFGFGNTRVQTGVTYSQQIGAYTRIGNRVWAGWGVVLTSKGGQTGDVSIGNLPFAVLTTLEKANGGNCFDYFNVTGFTSCPWVVYDNTITTNPTTSMRLREFGTGSHQNIPGTKLQDTSGIFGNAVYQCAT